MTEEMAQHLDAMLPGLATWVESEEFSEAPRTHRHKCPKCSTVWEHESKLLPDVLFRPAHTCPKCGTFETRKFVEEPSHA